MNMKVALVFTLVPFVSLTTQSNAESDLAVGLAAHYRFDGNSTDATGKANHGTNSGGVVYGIDRFSRAGRCLQLDGTGKVTLGQILDSNPTNFTQSAWVLSPAVADGKSWNPTILTRRHAESDDWIHFGVNPEYTATTLNWCYDRPNWKSEIGLIGRRLSDTIINLSKWNHLVAVKSGSEVNVYLNGLAYYNALHTRSFDGSSSPFIIGYHGAWNRYFTGKIDDVRIYSRSLSAEDVALLYQQESYEGPRAAAAQSSITAGYLTGVTIADSGAGYTTSPTVRVVGGGGSGAKVVAILHLGGVASLVITNAGSGYTSPPRVIIESPPFLPSIEIGVSKVKVIQKVRINHNYLLESSSDLVTWTATGPAFIALEETISEEFDVTAGSRYFRLREVP